MRVELCDIKQVFQQKTVVDIGRLQFAQGQIHAVIGPNGSGKTTLLRLISGIGPASSGKIFYDDCVTPLPDSIGYMPQNTYLFDLTVLENVMVGLRKGGARSGEIRKRARSALADVGMESFSDCKARNLSGGEAQRVALARLLVLGKSLILLDEPASATDISGMERVERYIRTVNTESGATVILTTHNPSQAARLASDVIMMYEGKVLEQGAPLELFASPRKQETRDFLRNWRL